MPAESLGFFMPDYSLNAEKPDQLAKQPDDVEKDAESEGYDPSIAADAAVDAPVDVMEGEPLAEDRVVHKGPDEAIIHLEGCTLTINSPLRALRAGCLSLGLSKRGSKQTCMKCLLDHFQTQSLLAAHGAEVRLKAEAEREVRGQKIPSVPTQAEIDNHNLTRRSAMASQNSSTSHPIPSRHTKVVRSHINSSLGAIVVSTCFGAFVLIAIPTWCQSPVLARGTAVWALCTSQ